jgi:hypothetical protein
MPASDHQPPGPPPEVDLGHHGLDEAKPVGRARQLWAWRRELITAVDLPDRDRQVVIPAVRWVAVYRAVMVNTGTVGRFAAGTAWFALAVTAVFTVIARPAELDDWALTWAGVTGGLVMTFLVPVGLLTVVLTLVIRRWPQATRPAHQMLWSALFTAALVTGVYAAGRPPGFLTAVMWGVPACVVTIWLPDLALTSTIVRWHNSHYRKGAPARAYRKWLALRKASAAEQLLRVTVVLASRSSAWKTPDEYAVLTGQLTLAAQQAFQAHRELARGSRWTSRGRDHNRVVLGQAFRLRQAIFDLRDSLSSVTRQREYDALVDRARAQTVALADNDWDALPACPITRSPATALVTAFSVCTLSFASGVTVNAVSNHLPGPMKQAPVALVAGAAAVVVATLFTWRRVG